MARTYRLSKSRFTAGLQCHRQLWWKVHEPRAPELRPDAALQAVFDMGNRVGARAREEFPNAVLIDFDYRRPLDSVKPTRQAIDAGASVILEASFFEDDIFVAVDALSKEGEGWVITEVKATTRVKPQHIPDAAVQAHVVEKAGLPVVRVELMHLNREHRHPDKGPLFIRADISADVAAFRSDIAGEARAQMQMLAGELPDVEPGAHCTSPYECPFLDRCAAPAPDHGVDELNGIRAKKLDQLREAGIETVDQIPSDFPLEPLWARHRAAVLQEQLIVEPGLHEVLADFRYPIAMLDFETVGAALPVWDGCSPFGSVPVQFSVHTLHEDGAVSHSAYLADGPGDPRRGVAAALVSALEGAQTILAWHASVEKRCLSQLAEACPEHAPALREALGKVDDLLVVFKNHLYHPDFHGSFSIKNVVPALLPDMAYDDLDVSDGQLASALLEQLLCRPEELPEAQKPPLQTQLTAYSTHDTAVMVELFKLLGTRSPPTSPVISST
ncbi:MAG: DUF2779 domain-containing protein [Deltaproteobacteria bacterium]|nr:DUF2779 domain-containing protein [Deltaproteobacteria bacterium]NNK08235.1 DUF2779 domain-containing protein [Myxococcales bacterium]